jgi:predicted negative regulator of RcsB-dependent stress response
VLNRDESYVAAYYHLGRLLALGGETEEARTAYAKGLEAAISAGDQRTRSEIQQALEML